MIEIELPCCGTATYVAELTDAVECEACRLVFDLGGPHLPAAAGVAELRAPAHAPSSALAVVLIRRLGIDSASATRSAVGWVA